jgi:hypothetical protein
MQYVRHLPKKQKGANIFTHNKHRLGLGPRRDNS